MMDEGQPRVASRAALSAVMRFLAAVDPEDPGDRRRPLGNLLAALASLEEGRTAPLLEPAPRSGRAPDPIGTRTIRAQAAAIADLLVAKTGMQRYEADRAVGTLMHKHGVRVGRIKTTHEQAVAEWRRDLKRKTRGDPLDQQVYEEMKTRMDDGPPARTDQERAELRKAMLARLAGELEATGHRRSARRPAVD